MEGFVSGQAAGSVRMCVPNISAKQFRLIVEKHMGEHPQELHQQAGLLVMSALMEAFVCKR
jgi:hypothetical protein